MHWHCFTFQSGTVPVQVAIHEQNVSSTEAGSLLLAVKEENEKMSLTLQLQSCACFTTFPKTARRF